MKLKWIVLLKLLITSKDVRSAHPTTHQSRNHRREKNKSLHSPRTRTIILHAILRKYTHEAYLLFYHPMRLKPKPKNQSFMKRSDDWMENCKCDMNSNPVYAPMYTYRHIPFDRYIQYSWTGEWRLSEQQRLTRD